MIRFLWGLLLWIGALGSFFPGFPGSWIMVGVLLVSGLLSGFTVLPWYLTALGILWAVGAEVAETLVGAAGARRYGAGRGGVIGAILGSILGLMFLGPLGLILGAVAGAFVLEILYKRPPKEALRAGVGATLGILSGALVKGILLVTLALILTLKLIF